MIILIGFMFTLLCITIISIFVDYFYYKERKMKYECIREKNNRTK